MRLSATFKALSILAISASLSACSKADTQTPATPKDMSQADMRPDAGRDLGPDQAPDDASPDLKPPLDMNMEEPILDPQRLSTAEEAFALVNPFIGTGGAGYGFSALTPAAQVPLGLVRLGPDTTRSGVHHPTLHFGGYNMSDPHVRGFSHTHFVGTGVADWGHIRVSPLVSLEDLTNIKRYHELDKDSERATPGYYTAKLLDPNVEVALTSTAHTGMHRYTFADSGRVHIALDMTSSIRDEGVEDAELSFDGQELTGWVRYRGSYIGRRRALTIYVVATLDTPATQVQVWDNQGLADAGITSAQGTQAGGLWAFDDIANKPVTLRVALSVVDQAQARAHMEQELPPTRTFEQVQEAARQAWLSKLGRVRVAGGTADERQIFYTALYNVYRMPTTFTGIDGRYLGLDGQIHQAEGFTYYTDLSLWDTFRTLHPWYLLVDQDTQRDCLRSLIASGEQNGVVPRWPAGPSYTGGMIGTSADMLFGESAIKGLEGIDWGHALELLLVTADGRPPEGVPFSGRGGIEEYISLGYVPLEAEGDATSATLEYAYNDWALSKLATVANRPEVAERMRLRANNYKNTFDPKEGFARGRMADGSFSPDDFNPSSYTEGSGPYTEGTAWHWSFYAPHDMEGLRELFGAQRFDERIEELFAKSALGKPNRIRTLLPDRYYWHGNEPALHSVYLFHASSRTDRMSYWLDQIRTRLYLTSPDGLPGNDDGGTLSGWYLFSALGLYPIAGDERYWWGSPVFTRAEIDMAPGKTLTITAPEARPGHRLTQQVEVDGQPVQGPYLRHEQLGGATINFQMAPLP